MKHPVDTSTWGEFKVGELFDVHPTKAYKLKNSDLLSVDGEIPVVVNSSYNNGIGGYSKLEPTEQPGILTFSDTTSGSNTLFYQNQAFIGYAHVQGMYPKKFELTDLTALFMIATLRATIDQRKWDYTNKLNRTTVIKMHVKRPLKQGTNPADYSQEDIDWDYMEGFMSRVQDAAKERLTNLPEPGQKSKTPVDVSKWGVFKARDLFGPSKLGKYHNPKDLRMSDNGYEYICATTMNNGINQNLSCVIGNKLTIPFRIGGGLSLTPPHIIAWGKQSPYFTYHENPCVTSQGMYFVEVTNKTRNQIHFLITVLNKISSGFSYTNCLTGKIFDELSIPLPLKQGTNPSDYSQDDIDWDYMESFMSQFQNLAKNRVEQLSEK